MKRQSPIRVVESAWLCKRNCSTKQVEGKHEIINPTLRFFTFDKQAQNAQVHWNRTKLKWKNPPTIFAIFNNIKIKQLFVQFCQDKESTNNSQNNLILSLICFAQKPCERYSNKTS